MRKELPVVVAAFADERQVDAAIARLKAFDVGPDLIGVCMRVDGRNGHSRDAVHLLSVMASPRLREDTERLLRDCRALSVGGPSEMRAAFDAIPHPGVFEDGGMKLPMELHCHESTNHGCGG